MSTNLSREEIELLLQKYDEEAVSSRPPPPSDEGSVQQFDLAGNEPRIVRGRLPGLELVIESFCRSARETLSKYLNSNIFLSVSRIDMEKFGSFSKKLSPPASLHLFQMPPLRGQALLVLSTPLVFALVEVLLGGKSKRNRRIEGREFSPIEARLIAKVTASILEEFQRAFETLEKIQCVYTGSEVNPLALSFVSSTENVIIIEVEMNIEEVHASLTFCLPQGMLQPIHEILSSGSQRSQQNFDRETRARMAKHLHQTQCELRVCLAHGHVTVRDMLKLNVGDIIPLETRVDENAKIFVEGNVKFEGKVGSARGQKVVSINVRK